ncbi:MAG: transposase, partial [Victivallales bacterium]
YHVINRGNQRQKVFHCPSHYEIFLEKLREFSGKFDVDVRCYCLMPNHFHLYLLTREANLSRFMQSFLTSFCYVMNRMSGKSGHIFQGRFKSHLADDDAYGMAISRYIHLNPVKIKSAEKFDLKKKIRLLEEFRYSSYRHYIGEEECPEWLDKGHVLGKFPADSQEKKILEYRAYVEEGIKKAVPNPFESVVGQSIIGDCVFTEHIRRGYAMDLNLTDKREQKDLSKLRSSFHFDDVLRAVASTFNIEEKDILRRRSKHRTARMTLMYCADKYCRSGTSLSEMASKLSIGHSGLSRSKNHLMEIKENDKEINRALKKIEMTLKSITDSAEKRRY